MATTSPLNYPKITRVLAKQLEGTSLKCPTNHCMDKINTTLFPMGRKRYRKNSLAHMTVFWKGLEK